MWNSSSESVIAPCPEKSAKSTVTRQVAPGRKDTIGSERRATLHATIRLPAHDQPCAQKRDYQNKAPPACLPTQHGDTLGHQNAVCVYGGGCRGCKADRTALAEVLEEGVEARLESWRDARHHPRVDDRDLLQARFGFHLRPVRRRPSVACLLFLPASTPGRAPASGEHCARSKICT